MKNKAEELARRWMPGFRQGPEKRRAWEHPQDLVNVLTKEMSFITVPEEEQEKRVAVAWLHDLLEDGVKEDGSRVQMGDLIQAKVDPEVLEDVLALTQGTLRDRDGKPFPEPKEVYLSRLKNKGPRAKLVKCVDRICNLREGRQSFKDRRWIRYVGETYYFIFPLADDGLRKDSVERGFLMIELIKAVEARRLGGCPYLP